MKTKAVRLYGKNDLRLEEFELPNIKDNEILMEIVCDSVCMSTHKATKIASEHWLVNNDLDVHPSIVGHEFAGVLKEVGSKWSQDYKVGDSYTVQVALKDLSVGIAGYSMEFCGGSSQYVVLPSAFMEQKNLLKFNDESGFYSASMAEPISCNIGAFHTMFHTIKGTRNHEMGIVIDGICGMFASCGPMGMGGIGYLLNCDRRPSVMVITDIDDAKLHRTEQIFSKEYAKERGVEIHYVNTSKSDDPHKTLMDITSGKGFNDISVYAPVSEVIELADSLLAKDGCLNFFSGPTDTEFKAKMNFYKVHYAGTHVIGTSGGNTDDMKEFLQLSSEGKLNPSFMVTHIGGLNAVIDTVLNLPNIAGGKKLIYPHVDLELTAISDFEKIGQDNPIFANLAKIVAKTYGMWSKEAETYLLENMK
ncbi:MAG: zinc-binding dehydrogenase [Lachnospirales bacterium]